MIYSIFVTSGDFLKNQVFRWTDASLCIQMTSYTMQRPTGIQRTIFVWKNKEVIFWGDLSCFRGTSTYHFLTLIDISPPAILYFWIWSHQGQKNQEKRGSKMFQFLYWNFLYSCLAMKTIDKGGLCSGLWNSNKIMIICALWSFVMLMMMMMMVMMMIGQKKNNLIEGKARGCAQLGSLHRALMELEFPNRVKIENVKISCGI